MEPALAKRLDDFRSKVKTEAEQIIFERWPTQILELSELLDSSEWRSSAFITRVVDATSAEVISPSESEKEKKPAKRKRLNENGAYLSDGVDGAKPSLKTGSGPVYDESVRTNEKLNEVLEILRTHCENLVDGCDKIKLWVNLTMPKIEDGDNFGVQVQEEVLSELHRSQEAALNLRDGIRTHYLSRGKLASKLLKYPHLEDYELALKEHDNKQIYMARQHLLDIRNIYAVLADLIQKNIAKLRAPKNSNGGLLY